MLDELVLDHLFEVGTLCTQLWQTIDYILNEVETVQVILHPHVERRGNGALFLVSTGMEVAVGTVVRQFVNQPGVTMERKDNVLVFCKQRIVI